MYVDEQNTSRDYLFGRLLALAEKIERDTFKTDAGKRVTNAERYIGKFATAPAATWATLFLKLKSAYLPQYDIGLRKYLEDKLIAVMNKFENYEINDNGKLSTMFLAGYTHERISAYEKTDKNREDSDNG